MATMENLNIISMSKEANLHSLIGSEYHHHETKNHAKAWRLAYKYKKKLPLWQEFSRHHRLYPKSMVASSALFA